MNFLLILFFAGLIAYILISVFLYSDDNTFLDEIASNIDESKKGNGEIIRKRRD